MAASDRQVIAISTGTFIRAILIAAAAWFVYVIRGVVGVLLVSILFAALMDPLAHFFEKRKIPRSVSIILIYVVVLALAAVLLFAIVPPMVDQVEQLAKNFSVVWDKFISSFNVLRDISARYGLLQSFQAGITSFSEYFSGAFTGLFSTIGSLVSGLISFFVVLVVAYFLVVEKNAISTLFSSVVPKRHHEYITNILSKMQHKVGEWLLGEIILMLFIGVITYIGLLVFGVKYALLLAVVAGAMEVVPYIGPVISLVPAVFFALSDSPAKAIAVIVLYLLIHRVENAILVPKVMQKATGLNPVWAILALAVGFEVGGIIGVVLAIPVATAANVIVADYLERQNKSA